MAIFRRREPGAGLDPEGRDLATARRLAGKWPDPGVRSGMASAVMAPPRQRRCAEASGLE